MMINFPISVVKILVPEDSVRPETLTLVVLIRRKGLVDVFACNVLTSSQLSFYLFSLVLYFYF